MLGSSLSQGPSTLAPRHVPCSSAKGHQVELPASQSIPCGSAALPTVNPQAPGAVPGPSRANPSVQDNTHLSSQSNVALKFVPVFKSHLLQANKSTLGPGKQKKRQQSTEALRAIGTQGDRLSLGPAVPKRLKGQLKAKARNTHHGASAPPQEQKGRYAKRGQHLPSFRTSSAVSLAEGEQLPSSSRSSLNAGREDSAAGFQVQEKRSVMSNYIAQLLGEEHVSFKVRSRPFIFESDWDTEAPQPQPPQAANQREGAGVSECRSSESQRTWPERKRKARNLIPTPPPLVHSALSLRTMLKNAFKSGNMYYIMNTSYILIHQKNSLPHKHPLSAAPWKGEGKADAGITCTGDRVTTGLGLGGAIGHSGTFLC